MSLASTDQMRITGLVAGADLSAKQYYCVKLASTAKQVIVGAAATDGVIGILQNDPGSGEEAVVTNGGVAKAAAEASVSAGDWVACSSTGRVKTTTTGGDEVVGRALVASSAAGDIISVAVGIFNY